MGIELIGHYILVLFSQISYVDHILPETGKSEDIIAKKKIVITNGNCMQWHQCKHWKN